jgi:hypothetical protein
MSDHEIGFKKPPRHTRFAPGNRAGCFKRKPPSATEIVERVLNTPIRYPQGKKFKRAPRIELLIRHLGNLALKGDVDAARKLLKMHQHTQKHGDINQSIEQELTAEDGNVC